MDQKGEILFIAVHLAAIGQRAPAIEQELAQLASEHRRCREEGRRVLQAIGEGNTRQSSMVAERLSELDEQGHQLERRMAELRDELAVIESETASPDEVQRAIALFDPIWDLLFPRERSRVLHLLLESAVYDGIKGELELQFYPLGISRLAAEAAMVGQEGEGGMSQHLGPSDETHEGDAPGERVTLSVPIHLATPTRRIVVREGPKRARPIGRIPRVARILAQAHHFQHLLDTGVVRTQMELAELTKLTTARITQMMNLLVLAPDIQEEILFMPPVTKGPAPVTERELRSLLKTLVWSEQRERWAALRA